MMTGCLCTEGCDLSKRPWHCWALGLGAEFFDLKLSLFNGLQALVTALHSVLTTKDQGLWDSQSMTLPQFSGAHCLAKQSIITSTARQYFETDAPGNQTDYVHLIINRKGINPNR